MIAGMTYYQIGWYFLIYSFLGWALEVAFHAISQGKVVNRGFLNGPLCPIYGCGVIAVFAMGHFMGHTPMASTAEGGWTLSTYVVVYAMSTLLATAIELVGGWLLDRCFHMRWWDYSNRRFNFRGYICLSFSLIWGALIMIIFRYIQPLMSNISEKGHFIPESIGWWILLVLYALLLVDFIITVAFLIGLNRKLEELEKMRSSMRTVSDHLSDTIATTTIKASQTIGETRVQAALGAMELSQTMSEKKDELTQSMSETKDAITQSMTETRETITQSMSETKEAITQSMAETKETIAAQMNERKEAWSQTMDNTKAVLSSTMDGSKDAFKNSITGSREAAEAAASKAAESIRNSAEGLGMAKERMEELLGKVIRGFGRKGRRQLRRISRAFPNSYHHMYKQTLADLEAYLKRFDEEQSGEKGKEN